MFRKVLTPLAVKAAKAKRNAAGELVRAEYPDGGCAGLYLIVQASGRKSWALRYRFNGDPRKLTLGAAADARYKVEQGIDPAAQKRSAKTASVKLAAQRAADSVEALAE